MPDPNEPRLMPIDDGEHTFDIETGNAGLDGYTLTAAMRPIRKPTFPDFPSPPGQIDPPVGKRDYTRGPRFESEDI